MRLNTPRRRLVGVIASVGIALFALSGREAVPVVVPAPRIDTPPVAESLHPSGKFLLYDTLYHIDILLKAVRGGERFAVVRFARDRFPNKPAYQAHFRMNGNFLKEFEQIELLRVRGDFDTVQTLRDGFSVGWVDETVQVRSRWGGDSAYRRLMVLSRATLAEPQILLAVSKKRSDDLLDAHLHGPFEQREVRLLVEWFEQAKGSATAGKRQAEKWLRFPNPWLVWLGLHRLQELKVLTPTHFGEVIERRPVAETGNLLHAMFREAAADDASRAEVHRALEKVFPLPEKGVFALNRAAIEFENHLAFMTPRTDVPRLLAWLRGFREKVANEAGSKEVLLETDALISALKRPTYRTGPSTPPLQPHPFRKPR